jgi:hypothetical protein
MTTPDDLTLAALPQDFPGYRLWLEPGRGKRRFVARRCTRAPAPTPSSPATQQNCTPP